jgi:hypothetical protein
VVVVDHGETRTTYEPVEATVAVGQGSPRAPSSATCSRRLALSPAVLPALGLVARRDLPRPARPGRRRPVRLLPLWRDVPVPVTGPMVTAPWSTAYATVLRRIETLVARSPPAVYARGCACW